MKRCTDDDVRVGVIGHGGLLREFSFARPRSPDKGSWACLGDLPQDMPRQPETWVSLSYSVSNDNLLIAFRDPPGTECLK